MDPRRCRLSGAGEPGRGKAVRRGLQPMWKAAPPPARGGGRRLPAAAGGSAAPPRGTARPAALAAPPGAVAGWPRLRAGVAWGEQGQGPHSPWGLRVGDPGGRLGRPPLGLRPWWRWQGIPSGLSLVPVPVFPVKRQTFAIVYFHFPHNPWSPVLGILALVRQLPWWPSEVLGNPSLISEGPSGSKGGRAMGKTGNLGFIQQPVPKDC